ncbi:hypothetical protein [Flammeovirga kamogawensis]|uniref:RHS repeat protein n=1 Tax=Flammeovirga kamogawensis TaxID=373891 RepID=A0ABX8H0E2_9BACT|nr:hypothetical protein [Flammeovirga kamogawensis]MBB6459318.1 hypothetical protein [Flammeovirga kamogawensis]QWG08877.1 hypothetical protein KM029_08025 [Flammeovirga kamogawensis]TRX67167.1 hypothetical protein EO216_03070 [Flammeovirga kamogawensis]
MKNTLSLFILSLFFACSTSTEKLNSDLKELKLNGEIKAVVTLNYIAESKNGEIVKGPQASYTEEIFDKNGNIIVSKGGYTNTFTRKYDDKGNLIEELNFWDNKVVRRYKYETNDRGDITKAIIFGQGGEMSQTRYSIYDSNGYFIEMKVMDSKGKLESKLIVENDNLGREIKQTYFNSIGEIEGEVNFAYDKMGNKILDETKLPNGTTKERLDFEYDAKGLALKQITKSKYENSLVAYEYINFDKHGNWILRYSREKRLDNNLAELKPRSYEKRIITYL